MKTANQPILTVFATTALFLLSATAVLADFKDLLAKLPPGANTVVMINAEQMFGSEVATQGGWKQKYDATFSDAPLMLPPGAQQFVLAADIDLGTMNPRWQAAVVRMADDLPMTVVARTVRGSRDTIGSLEAVSTPRGALVLKFAPQLFGMMHPGSRQAGARWIRDAAGGAGRLSPYLASAASVPDQVGTEIIMAIDLGDSLSLERVEQAMAKSDVLTKAKINPQAAADVLTSLQGATLGIRVTRRAYGKLKIDFARDVAPLAAVAKPLVLEVLSEAGASIDEFNDWKVEIAQRQIALDGELTGSGLRRLFSFLDLDGTAISATAAADATTKSAPGAAAPSGSENYSTAEASLKYFQAIQRHLGDLRSERGASSYGSIALWFDKYARRIDKLPILGVDKDLVDYGQYVVQQLRDAVDAIRGVGIRSGARNAGTVGYANYNMFDSAMNYTASAVTNAEAQKNMVRAQERAQGSADARTLMRDIEDKTSAIKRQMTERYQIEFGATPAKQ